jgi:hypothetical protein
MSISSKAVLQSALHWAVKPFCPVCAAGERVGQQATLPAGLSICFLFQAYCTWVVSVPASLLALPCGPLQLNV